MADEQHLRFSRLLDQHGSALVLYARQWPCDAEDVVQDALVSLMRQSPPPENPARWLYRVVRNGAIDASRRQAVRASHERKGGELRDAWFESNLETPLDAADAQRALAALPLELREVVVLRIWGGHTLAEIGELTGCSSSTAHRNYNAALAELRKHWSLGCPNVDR